MKSKKIQAIVETGVLIALAVVLELIATGLPLLKMPQGGHFTLALLPLAIIGFRRGWKYGFPAAVIYALINMLMDGFWGLGSLLFDYLFAFGVFGICGFFSKKARTSLAVFLLVILVAFFFRYLFASLSGMLFFGNYATDYGMSAFYYSFIFYNLPYCAASCFGTLVMGTILYRTNVIFMGLPPEEVK